MDAITNRDALMVMPRERRDAMEHSRRVGDDPHALLRHAGLRPTRQRSLLAKLLFVSDHRHVTAAGLQQEAKDAGINVTLATVYNTLNRFADAELLRRIAVKGNLTFFDTKTGDHAHFYIEPEDRFLDLPEGAFTISRLPEPPSGYAIVKVDVVVRLRRIRDAGPAE